MVAGGLLVQVDSSLDGTSTQVLVLAGAQGPVESSLEFDGVDGRPLDVIVR